MSELMYGVLAIVGFISGMTYAAWADRRKDGKQHSSVPLFLVRDEVPEIMTTEMERENEQRGRTEYARRYPR
jgi:hypothetical protein